MDWAAIVQTVVGAIVTIALAWFAYLIQRMKVTGEQTLVHAAATDHAVNGKDPRTATISEQVDSIRAKQERDSPTDLATAAKDVDDALLPLVKKLAAQVAEIAEQLAPPEKPKARKP